MIYQKDFNWGEWQSRTDVKTVDFHWGKQRGGFYVWTSEVYDIATEALKTAQAEGMRYVLFTHGSSTAGPGKTTARSIVRAIIKSKEATPYIIRRNSIQARSSLLVAIRSLDV